MEILWGRKKAHKGKYHTFIFNIDVGLELVPIIPIVVIESRVTKCKVGNGNYIPISYGCVFGKIVYCCLILVLEHTEGEISSENKTYDVMTHC